MTDITDVNNLETDGAMKVSGAAPAVDQETQAAVRYVLTVALVAWLSLLAFNSSGIRSWARDLPPSVASDRIIAIADQWHEFAGWLGLTGPGATTRAMLADLRDYSWPEKAEEIAGGGQSGDGAGDGAGDGLAGDDRLGDDDAPEADGG